MENKVIIVIDEWLKRSETSDDEWEPCGEYGVSIELPWKDKDGEPHSMHATSVYPETKEGALNYANKIKLLFVNAEVIELEHKD